jgi:hypothetical protein
MKDNFDVHAWNINRYLNENKSPDLESELQKYSSSITVQTGEYKSGGGFGNVKFMTNQEIPQTTFDKVISDLESRGYKIISQDITYDVEPGEKISYPKINFEFEV